MKEETFGQSTIFEDIEFYRPVYYASTGKRFGNYLVDRIVFYAANYAIGLLIAQLTNLGAGFLEAVDSWTPIIYSVFLNLALYILGYTMMEGSTNGKTVGKYVTKTRAVRADGQPFSFKDALLRGLCRCIPFNEFSALSGRPWHDRITKTHVVED